MLKQRVITAIVLLLILSGTLSTPNPWPLLIFLSIACACGCWEWLRLTMSTSGRSPALIGFILFFASVYQSWVWVNNAHMVADFFYQLVVLTSLGWICLVLPAVLRGNVAITARSVSWSFFGVATLGVTWACLAMLFLEHGAVYLCSLLAVVWVADIAAYFGGKALGKHKLAIRISPGKTIEGAVTAMLGVGLWIVISAQMNQTFAAELVKRWGLTYAMLFSVLLTSISIVGDLFESLLKRRAGVKDSSQLLPGHGGVLDRIDAVIALIPLAFVLTEFK